VTEQQLQGAVIDMCKIYGIACYHPYFSRRSAPGWPDLAICGTRGFITRELKTAVGRVSEAQERWGQMLRLAGISWDVWRPDDMTSGRIQRELLAIR
jgi:hypothetical protein